ncbi:biotin--[acetyl-CoA-carboxylase] ligase [Acidocella sp.]|uniref:biotin--[acetyl-CoA-carboxylase] ligase n=1 Tax=Acidocella sp. TaxID=50710 RepID=UPI00260E86EC|nr:biotin--[acetyl-CoA-carboxylase] ligase [Acidocella sp.]
MTGWRLEVFEELPSTSAQCVERARLGEAAGLAVMALRQTAGRGSRGRVWQAPHGNLSLSVLLRPCRLAAEAGMFALLAGVAVAEALEILAPVITTLKWPNDVLLGPGKLAGILIDAAPAGLVLDWLVLGIGVNLREAPRIEGRQTTALGEHGVVLAPQSVAHAVLERLGDWQDKPAATIREAWLARAHPFGTPIEIASGGRLLQGSFAGLTPAGELLLQTENRIETISTGEVLLGPP